MVAQMRTVLSTSVSPMDYNVQAVLPGVNSRLNALQHQNDQMLRLVQQQQQQQQQLLQFQQSANAKLALMLEKIGLGFVGVADSLRAGTSNEYERPSVRRRIQEEPTRTTTTNNDGDELHQVIGHPLVVKHYNLQSMYDEWFGLNKFEGKPIAGGIAALEKKYKTQWRKRDAKKANRVSRQKRICEKLRTMNEDEFNEWDKWYKEDTNSCIADFVPFLQAKELLPIKQNRGRKSMETNKTN